MRGKSGTELPPDFSISIRVKKWAQQNNFDQLETHLEYFILKAEANGYRYANWDSAFMTAIRDDWAKLRTKKNGSTSQNLAEFGKSIGIEARPGESMEQFERRVAQTRH